MTIGVEMTRLDLRQQWITDFGERVIAFAETKMVANHQRDDYNEPLELVIIFFGGALTQGIRFIAPGVLFIRDVDVSIIKMLRSLSN